MALNFEEYNAPIYKDDSNDKDSSESPKQQAPRRRSPNTEKKPHLPFLKDKRFRRVTGAIFILFAIYLLISGVSYFSTGAADQSAVDANSILANAKSQNIQNQGGPLGASLSELLFNKGFGWGAFCLIYMLGALGLKLIWKYKYRASSTILISLVATVTISSILGFTDMLFGNEDRHLNNIAVLRRDEGFDYCPLFDFGAGLLSNTRDYPLDIEPRAHLWLLRALPLGTTFGRHVQAAQTVYGPQLERGGPSMTSSTRWQDQLVFMPSGTAPISLDR